MTLLYQPNMLITKFIFKGFARGSVLKNLPGFNPWVREHPLEKGIATHSSILPGKSWQGIFPSRDS